jgi:hypothetical protein
MACGAIPEPFPKPRSRIARMISGFDNQRASLAANGTK